MLSVLTLNIWNYEGNWQQRLPLIRKWIELLDPDLIGLQEVLLGDSQDQAAEIFDGFEYHREYAGAMAYWNDESLQIGNLVASRWPLKHATSITLPKVDTSDERVLLCSEIDSPHGVIPFYTTHLSSSPAAGYIREQQIQFVAETINQRRNDRHFTDILCGDFNAAPDSNEMQFMRGLVSLDGMSFYMMDAWEIAGHWGPGYTFSRYNSHLKDRLAHARLDYIYVSRSRQKTGEINYCGLVCDVPHRNLYPSDHFGLYAEILTEG